MTKRIRPLALLLVLLLAACGGAEAGSDDDAVKSAEGEARALPKVPEAAGMRVETAVLGRSKAGLELSLPGEVRGSRDALLGSQLGGYVEAVSVTEGQRVTKGTTLVRVDASSYRLQVEQARAQYEQAAKELKRVEGLGSRVAEAAVDAARTQATLAELQLKAAEVQLSRAQIRAPFSGVIAGLDVEVGEILSPGAPVLRLVKMQPVEVSLSVSDRDIPALKEGMPVRVLTDASSGITEGRIAHISPAADIKTRSFLVDVEVANRDERLMPGMIARVHLRSNLEDSTLVIPQDYLVTRLDGVGVFVNEGDTAVWRPVTLGPVIGDQVVVLSGVSEGEKVVVTGQRELADGDPLITAREGRCCENGRTVFERADDAPERAELPADGDGAN